MKRVVLAAALAVIAGCTNIGSAPGEPAADAQFRSIYETEWAWRNTYDPQWDDATPDDKLPTGWGRVDAASQAEQFAYMTGVIAKLHALDAKALSPEAQINLAIYRDQIEVRMARIEFREYEKPLNADSTFWGNVAGATPTGFRNEAQARSWIAMLNDIPRFFADETANMKLGLARGFTPPRVTLQGRAESISAVYENKTPEESQFYEPFNALPTNIPAETRATLQAEAKAVIADKVFPAYRALLPYFRDEYLPRTATDIAATKLPNGHAYYAAQIREFTTLKKSPEDIHQIGVAEVAKIKARMREVMKEAGFTGDLPAFLTFLRTDPQFYAKTPEELLMRAAWISKKFDGKAKYFFGRLPRARFDVIPVPDDIAPFYTAGRGGTGVYLVNTYNLPSRALYSLPALTLHESAPGHAFQMPLADEQEGVPDFRRKTYISAFGEGWALYCELLGEEMGVYQTPYEKFGMLSYQMWRAARLVVDTGIHAKGWTREQGQAFFRESTALAEHEITTEVDRYISWPGQALSYYLGEMAIVESRKRAEAALGSKFDIRNFHDTVLQLGSVPLPVLDARIDRFIAEGGPDPYAGRPSN
ncbi:MAG: DUF885 family protein [Alphaproteobacteria bacterium]|jgi:uncharacterized protein (DUF885 family)|nr:MAG: DUF885 family protein [Alphaproteobacteria bacterium]